VKQNHMKAVISVPEAAEPDEVLDLLKGGLTVTAISERTGWPPRQIGLLASRHGYLIAADGTARKPPPHGDQAQRPH
jgi:hypothetical protein